MGYALSPPGSLHPSRPFPSNTLSLAPSALSCLRRGRSSPRPSSHPFLTLSLSLLSFEPNTTSSAGPVYACLSSLSFFLLSTSVTAVPFSPPRYPSLIFLPPLRSYHLAAPTFLTSSSSLSIHLPIRLSIYIYTYNIYIFLSPSPNSVRTLHRHSSTELPLSQ